MERINYIVSTLELFFHNSLQHHLQNLPCSSPILLFQKLTSLHTIFCLQCEYIHSRWPSAHVKSGLVYTLKHLISGFIANLHHCVFVSPARYNKSCVNRIGIQVLCRLASCCKDKRQWIVALVSEEDMECIHRYPFGIGLKADSQQRLSIFVVNRVVESEICR